MSSPERREGLGYRCPERTHATTAIRPEAGSGACNVTQKNKCSNASRKPLAEQLVPPRFLQYGSLGCNADSKLTEDHKWQVQRQRQLPAAGTVNAGTDAPGESGRLEHATTPTGEHSGL